MQSEQPCRIVRRLFTLTHYALNLRLLAGGIRL
jgi:hypothetical protein